MEHRYVLAGYAVWAALLIGIYYGLGGGPRIAAWGLISLSGVAAIAAGGGVNRAARKAPRPPPGPPRTRAGGRGRGVLPGRPVRAQAYRAQRGAGVQGRRKAGAPARARPSRRRVPEEAVIQLSAIFLPTTSVGIGLIIIAVNMIGGITIGTLQHGMPMGEAVQEGRKKVLKDRDVDWADYIHYGSYDFQLKASDAT